MTKSGQGFVEPGVVTGKVARGCKEWRTLLVKSPILLISASA